MAKRRQGSKKDYDNVGVGYVVPKEIRTKKGDDLIILKEKIYLSDIPKDKVLLDRDDKPFVQLLAFIEVEPNGERTHGLMIDKQYYEWFEENVAGNQVKNEDMVEAEEEEDIV